MARPGVTEQETFEAIHSLIEMGAKVTVERVRETLGHGSPNTINRYLRTWREKPHISLVPQSPLQVKQLKKKCQSLEEELATRASQAESLSGIILERDQRIAELEKAHQTQESEKAQLVRTLESIQHTLEILQAEKAAVTEEREALLTSLVEAQQQLAEQFRDDLKAINEMSLNQVREISMSAQDRWLEEKIKARELSLEIERLKLLNKTLEEKILQLNAAQAPLQKRMRDQEKMIAHCLDPQKVEAFRQQAEGER
jgi:colicin import membrane protein